MFDPKLTDPHPESARTHPQKVHCSLHDRDATIVVAHWAFSGEGWGDWRVLDCSLLPPRAVHCGMECLSQVRLKDE